MVWRERTAAEAAAGIVGEFERASVTIWIWGGLRGDVARSVLCHEIVHAIIHLFAISMPEGDDEPAAGSLGAHTYAVLAPYLNFPNPPWGSQ